MTFRRKKKEEYLKLATNKKLLASLLGISRKSIYYQRIKETQDLALKEKIETLHLTHPAYGHRRVALALNYGRNRIRRVMKKYGLKPPRRRGRKIFLTRSVNSHHYTNLIKDQLALRPRQIFVSDLTYLSYQNQNIYLATVEDLFTREILAANLSNRHDSTLSLSIIKEALHPKTADKNNDKNTNHRVFVPTKPEIFHSDQGSEFMAQAVTSFLERNGVKVSVSDKASPWQNGYKESFFGRFKEEFGDLNRFESLGELIEEVYAYVHYHNHLRIHTSLKMPPAVFRQKYVESVSQKSGT